MTVIVRSPEIVSPGGSPSNGSVSPAKLEQWVLNGKPTMLRETYDRRSTHADQATLTAGQELAAAIVLYPGDVVSTLTLRTGATPASAPTHWGLALFDGTQAGPVQVAASADQLTAAIAANTNISLAMQAAYTYTGTAPALFYVVIWFAGTTAPTLRGVSMGNSGMGQGLVASQLILAWTKSGVTTAPVTPASSPTASGSLTYAVAT